MLLDEVVAKIKSAEIAPAFAGGFPTSGADEAIAVFEYPGEPPIRVKDQVAAVSERPRFQVLCRSKRHSTARLYAGRVFALLDGFRGEMGEPPVFYSSIRALQSPFFLDRDDEGRTRIANNFSADKALSPTE